MSAPNGPDIRAWATRERGGTVHVVLINDSLTSAHTLQVNAPAHGSAQLVRLLAPNVASTTGVTLGGQSFGSSTTTGLLYPQRRAI